MHEIHESIHIDLPRDAVWPYFLDPDKIKQYGNFEEFEQVTEGPVDKGTRWHNVMRFLGKRMEMTDEITEFEAGRRLVFRPVESPIGYTMEQWLEDETEGTTVHFDMQTEDSGGFFGKVAEPVLAKLLARDIRGQLERLKLLAESEAAA